MSRRSEPSAIRDHKMSFTPGTILLSLLLFLECGDHLDCPPVRDILHLAAEPAETIAMTNHQNEPVDDIHKRVVRSSDMIPCRTAFIDAKTPGNDKKENYCLIGAGVAENANQVVHINIPHGFDMGAARQPHGCKNSHHSHNTAEVFVVQEGQWKFTWGHDGSDGELVLNKGGTISIPTRVFRGFENVGADDGFLLSMLGVDEQGTPGKVTWAPYVFENAKPYGLVLLEDGRLIDTSDGTPVPEDGVVVAPTTMQDVAGYRRMNASEMSGCVQSNDELDSANEGSLSCCNGVRELAVLGTENPGENIGAGKISWAHGFQVRRLVLQPGARVAEHVRAEEEVLFVHRGNLTVTTTRLDLTLSRGDLFTVPIGLPRTFSNSGSEAADVVVVRGGEHPEPAQFSGAG